MIGAALGDAGGNRAHAHFRHQLDRDAGLLVHALEVSDQLRQVFDGIDVVMRRRRDQADAGRGMTHLGDVGIHLVAGQLAAFAGLGALGHLDLDVVGIDQIFGGDAKAARRHLLDGAAHGVAIGHRLEAVGFLAALAGVGTPADAVHGDGQRGVGLTADGAEAHGAGGEALDDVAGGFHLVQRDRRAGLELHQPAQGEQALILVVDLLGEQVVLGRIVAAHRMLQAGHRVRRPGMVFAAQAEGIVAAHIQHVAIDGIVAIGVAVAAHAFLGNLLEADAFHRGGGAGEELLDELAGQAHGVENLRAAIGLVGGDAHLGHHFQDALADGLDVVLLHLIGLEREPRAHADLLQRLKGEIGIDGFGAIARQDAEVMHFARFAGFHHQPGLHAQALADQVVMNGCGGQRRGNRDAVRRGGAVRQNENVVVGQHGIGGVVADAQDGIGQAVSAFGGRPGAVNGGGAEGAVHQLADGADLLHIGIGQHRLRNFQPLVRTGIAAQEVGARPDHRDQAHHQLFADRIDRRIGDLGEVLLEVVVEQLGLLRQHRDRRVGAHGAQRVIAHRRHRLQEELQVFLGVAKGLLLVEQQRGIIRLGAMILGQVGQLFQLVLGALQPLFIGLGVGELLLDLLVFDDAAFLEINQQHLAGLQAPLALDLLLRHRDHARFRSQDDEVIFGHDVARGAQAVAVQRGADLAAVGEGDGRGTVPRLH